MGKPLMPWQRLVADVAGKSRIAGLAYPEVIVTVPGNRGRRRWFCRGRCNGRSVWDTPQRIVYSAQSGNDARKKLVEDQVPDPRAVGRQVPHPAVLRGMGNEAVEFTNGSRIVLLASSADSGHGKTVDMAVKDELFADTDNRRDQALVPAMATKAAAQILTLSTMGTDESLPLNRAVERGRAAAEAGAADGIAYFEWSADR